MNLKTTSVFPLALLFGVAPALAAPRPCQGKGVELQILGSGGPEIPDGRASSAYLLWIDGKGRVLVDFGGGAKVRLGESGAHFDDLEAVLFSHLHEDHCGDFPALVKSGYFEDRQAPLPVFGPAGNDDFPSVTEFIEALFGEKGGAFRYLSSYVADPAKKQEHFVFVPKVVAPVGENVLAVPATNRFRLSAAHVVHGHVPALAWRIDLGPRAVVFSGDTTGYGEGLSALIKGADLFVAHNAVPEGADRSLKGLHMVPSRIGELASSARVKHVVLSHRMLRTLGQEKATKDAIRTFFDGQLDFADDLDCFSVP
jgi:ribonuclease BN (tRNA processing enzyme)